MAATKKSANKPVMTDLKHQTLLTLRTLTEKNPASLETYEKLGGYAQLKRLVTEKVKATEIINQVKISNLRGRGGAGFQPDLNGASCRVTMTAPSIWFAILTKASLAHLKIATLFVITHTS